MILRRFLNKAAACTVLCAIVSGVFLILPVNVSAVSAEDIQEIAAGAQEDAAGQNRTEQSRAEQKRTVHMYPLWNEYPCIDAGDRYISMEEIASGKITEEEILNKITVTDKEDGTGSDHLLQNTDEKKYIAIPDFSQEELASFLHGGSVSITIQAGDSDGCVTQKRIRLNITDTTAKEAPQMQVRFVNEEYLDTVAENSVWKQRDEYLELLQKTVAENKKAGQKLVFSEESVSAAKQYIRENGYAGSGKKEQLQSFYQKFCTF